MESYIDASHWTSNVDSRSQSGIHISIGEATVYSRSRKQKINTKSATESEIVAVSDGISIIAWFGMFLEYQGYTNLTPAVVWEDNKGACDL